MPGVSARSARRYAGLGHDRECPVGVTGGQQAADRAGDVAPRLRGSRRPGDSGLALLPGGASPARSAASRRAAGDTARCPGLVRSPSRTAGRPPSAGAPPRCRCARTMRRTAPASRTSATDVRSKNSDRSFGARWRSSSASRSATIGVRPENSATAAGTSARSLSPAAASRRPATQPSVRRQSLSTSLADRRCSPSAVNSSAVSGNVSARSRWRSSASQPRPRHRLTGKCGSTRLVSSILERPGRCSTTKPRSSVICGLRR